MPPHCGLPRGHYGPHERRRDSTWKCQLPPGHKAPDGTFLGRPCKGNDDIREHVAHTPKYTASADDLAELAAEARNAADPEPDDWWEEPDA